MSDRRSSEDRSPGGRPNRNWPQDVTDKTVGSVASVMGLLVVVASIPTQSRTGVLAMTGMVLGMFGYLLGARWLGSTAIIASTVTILIWVLV